MSDQNKELKDLLRAWAGFRAGLGCLFGGCLMLVALALLTMGIIALIAGLQL